MKTILKFSPLLFAVFTVLSDCGGLGTDYDPSVPTQTSPYINRLDPAAGSVGDTIGILGFGFSMVPQYNIITIGTVSTPALSYNLVDPAGSYEIERLDFTIPQDVAAGDYNIVVTVCGNPSNSNVTLTVNP